MFVHGMQGEIGSLQKKNEVLEEQGWCVHVYVLALACGCKSTTYAHVQVHVCLL